MDFTKTVYSLYWPETKAVVDNLWKNTHHEWYEDNYTKKQNEMHKPYLDGWRVWAAKANVKLGTRFKYEYPTNGASEGIQHLLSYYATHTKHPHFAKPVIHIFEGEYEGYRKVAEALNMRVIVHQRHNYKHIEKISMAGDIFWISQPSAIDGNVWPEFSDWVQWMNKNVPGVGIVVDLTYVGAVAKDYDIDLTATNIKAVLWSLSKPFGVYYHRIGGVVSSFELPTLYGNLWFKNLFSLHLGTELMKAYGPHDIPRKYQLIKDEAMTICFGNDNVSQSDVILLANIKLEAKPQGQDEYIRVSNEQETILRYCLTPTLDRIINEKSS